MLRSIKYKAKIPGDTSGRSFCVNHIRKCEHYFEGYQEQVKDFKQGNDGKICASEIMLVANWR